MCFGVFFTALVRSLLAIKLSNRMFYVSTVLFMFFIFFKIVFKFSFLFF